MYKNHNYEIEFNITDRKKIDYLKSIEIQQDDIFFSSYVRSTISKRDTLRMKTSKGIYYIDQYHNGHYAHMSMLRSYEADRGIFFIRPFIFNSYEDKRIKRAFKIKNPIIEDLDSIYTVRGDYNNREYDQILIPMSNSLIASSEIPTIEIINASCDLLNLFFKENNICNIKRM